jgi:cytidylate kinase
MNNSRLIITVDGHAGTGKTTLARLLAERLHYVHLNSGLLYRAVAWLSFHHAIAPDDSIRLAQEMINAQPELHFIHGKGSRLVIKGIDRTDEVVQPHVSERTSIVSVHKAVRDAVTVRIRAAYGEDPLVAEGRDMGTVVFPQAQHKFFITCSTEVRVARRIAQLYGDCSRKSADEIKAIQEAMRIEINERDARDSSRDLAPTKPAEGAIVIDNSVKPLQEVVTLLASHCTV